MPSCSGSFHHWPTLNVNHSTCITNSCSLLSEPGKQARSIKSLVPILPFQFHRTFYISGETILIATGLQWIEMLPWERFVLCRIPFSCFGLDFPLVGWGFEQNIKQLLMIFFQVFEPWAQTKVLFEKHRTRKFHLLGSS